MNVVCHNPVGERHEIADGDRRVELQLAVDWGDADIRLAHEKPMVFCSFGCLAGWAAEKAEQHDGQTLVEGADG